jgi:hypothetical protein
VPRFRFLLSALLSAVSLLTTSLCAQSLADTADGPSFAEWKAACAKLPTNRLLGGRLPPRERLPLPAFGPLGVELDRFLARAVEAVKGSPEAWLVSRPSAAFTDLADNWFAGGKASFEPFARKLELPPGSRVLLQGDLHGDILSLLAVVGRLQERGWMDGFRITAPDFHVATVEYERGAVAVFEHAWILPRTLNTVKDLKIEILGSEGALYVDGSHNRTLELYTAAKGTFPDMLVPPFGPHLTGFVLDAVAHFVDSVTDGRPLLATGQEGLENTRLITAMIAAAGTGRAVDLPR